MLPVSCRSGEDQSEGFFSRPSGAGEPAIVVPGSYPAEPLDLTPPPSPTLSAKDAGVKQPELDPTMDFSTLLIAKPLPFQFKLQVRNQQRAEKVANDWVRHKMAGDFPDARVFWGGGKSAAGDAEFGWGKVFA